MINLLGILNNLLFPKKHICLMCRENNSNVRNYICKDCFDNLDLVDKKVEFDSPNLKKIYYSLSYNRFIRDKMADYKFNGKNYLYKPFGGIMVDTIKKNDIYKYIDIIAYVPTHKRKEALRGYNQAELLASYISQSLNKPLLQNNLIKTKSTKDQSHLNRVDRIVNLKDSFQLRNNEEVEGKTILLVDDIITTGTTMEECSKILRKNGVKEVIGLALTSSKTN